MKGAAAASSGSNLTVNYNPSFSGIKTAGRRARQSFHERDDAAVQKDEPMRKIISILQSVMLSGLGQQQLVAQQCPAGSSVHTSSYPALAADAGKLLVMNCATACTVTLPSVPQTPQWTVWVETIGSGAVTISPNGLNLNGSASSMTLPTAIGATALVSTDGSNYFASAVVNPSIPSAMHVSPFGSDSNDGRTWASAKLDVYSAICSLPGGNCGTQLMGSGTIFVAPNSAANLTSTCGIWIMGVGDPNYASPPACWLKDPGVNLTIIGINSGYGNPNPHRPRTPVLGGGTADKNHPALWIAGNDGIPLEFDNISFSPAGRGIVIGECSNHLRDNTCNTVGLTFQNVSAFVGNSLTTGGPCTDLAGWNYWIWFRDFGCSGNATGNTNGYLSNSAASMLLDGTSGHGNGLIYISDANLDNGGIKIIPGDTGGSVFVTNVIEEGCCGNAPPPVWFTSWGAGTAATITNVTQADIPNNQPSLKNDATNTAYGAPFVIATGPVQGPAYLFSMVQSGTLSPLKQQQYGINSNYLVGETDVARRVAGFVPIGFSNLAFSNPSSWTTSAGTVSITTGVADPFRGTGAATLTSTAGGTVNLSGIVPKPGTAGDWFIAGIWVQGGGWAPAGENYLLAGCPGYGSIGDAATYFNGGLQTGDGQWQYIWIAASSNRHSDASECLSQCSGCRWQPCNALRSYGILHPERHALRQRSVGVCQHDGARGLGVRRRANL